jgi:hypothetical protein
MQFDKMARLAASYSLLPRTSKRSAGTNPAKALSTRQHFHHSLSCEPLSALIVDFPNVPVKRRCIRSSTPKMAFGSGSALRTTGGLPPCTRQTTCASAVKHALGHH